MKFGWLVRCGQVAAGWRLAAGGGRLAAVTLSFALLV